MAIADLNVLIGADISEFDKKMREAQRTLKRSAQALQGVADSVFKNITVPFAAAAGAGTKLYIDLDNNFNKIENLVGISGNSLKEFRDGVKNLSGTTAKSQAELSDALFTVTSAGLRGSAALDVLEASAKASAVGLGQTKEVARSVTSIIQAYGAENIDAATATEQLFKTVKEGNLDAEQLAPTLGKVLPVASALKVSFGELGANIASFTKLGVSAPEAITAVKSALASILKPTTEAKEALASIGLTTEDLKSQIEQQGLAKTFVGLVQAFDGNTEALAKVFGNVEGLANVLGVATTQAGDYIRISEEMTRSTNYLEEGFENSSKKIGFVFQQAIESSKNSLIELGDAVAPLVTSLSKGISAITGVFSNLDDGTKKNLVSMAAFAAGTGVALKGLSLLTSGVVGGIGVIRNMTQITKDAGSVILRFDDFVRNAGRGIVEAARSIGGATGKLAENAREGKETATTIQKLAQAYKGLSVVSKVAIPVAVLGVAIAAYAAYSNLSKAIDATTVAQRANNAVLAEAKAAIAVEESKVKSLIVVLNSEHAEREKKVAALNELKSVSPAYFGQLELEDGKVKNLTESYKKYSAAILNNAKLQAVANQYGEVFLNIQKLEQEIQRLESADFSAFEKAANALSPISTTDFKLSNARKELEALNRQADAFQKIQEDLISEKLDLGSPSIDAPGSGDLPNLALGDASLKVKVDGSELTDAQKALKEMEKALVLADARLVIHGDNYKAVEEKIKAYKDTIDSLLQSGESPTSETVQNLQKEIQGLDLELAKIERARDFPLVDSVALEILPVKIQGVTDQLSAMQVKIKETTMESLGAEMDKINQKADIFGSSFDSIAAKMALVETAINNLVDNGFKTTDPAVQALIAQLQELRVASGEAFTDLEKQAQQFQETFNSIIQSGMQEVIGGLAENIGDVVAGQAEASSVMAGMLGSVAGILGQLGKLAVASGIAAKGIQESFKLNPVAAIIGGAALIALSRVVRAKAAALAQGPGDDVPVKLAKGGLAYGPTLALVGDNPNAQFDPEVIAPLSKLQGMMNQGNLHITFSEPRWDGNSLVMGIEKYQITRERTRGY